VCGWIEHQINLRPEALKRIERFELLEQFDSANRLVASAIESTRRISQYRARRNFSCGNKGE